MAATTHARSTGPLKQAATRIGGLLRLPGRLIARPGYFRPRLEALEPASIALVACHWIGDTL